MAYIAGNPVGGSGGAVTVADGANVAEGATTDAAVSTDTTGTLSGKLRGLVKLLNSVVTAGKIQATADPITGTVTANAGTNLNTSLLALESGGNLALIKTDVDKIPSQGQALAAASMPVVLTAAQVTTLTPPAAITNYANETGGNLATLAGTVTSARAAVNPISGQIGVQGAAGVSTVLTQRVAIATDANAVAATLGAETTKVIGTVNQGTSPWVSSVTGSVTANAGTNLNTSTLALESGGNLAAIKTDVDKIPSQGQALAAASMPIVLTAAQVTTLTPPAAITGFALEAGHLATIDTSTAKIPAQGQALAAASMPVVLTAAQITTLTPLTAVQANAGTNLNTSLLALESGGNLATLAGTVTSARAAVNPISGQAGVQGAAGASTALTQRVAIATDANAVAATLAAETTKVIGTVNQGTSPWIVAGGGTAGAAATGIVTVQGIASMTKLLVTPDSVALPANQSVNVSQVAGTTTDVNNGTVSAGTQRVTLASDSTGQVKLAAGANLAGYVVNADPTNTYGLAAVSRSVTGQEYGLVTRPNQPENDRLLLELVIEMRKMRQAFQDWSGTSPRFDPLERQEWTQ